MKSFKPFTLECVFHGGPYDGAEAYVDFLAPLPREPELDLDKYVYGMVINDVSQKVLDSQGPCEAVVVFKYKGVRT